MVNLTKSCTTVLPKGGLRLMSRGFKSASFYSFATLLMLLATVSKSYATVVTVTSSGGTNICTNKAADGSAPGFTVLGAIAITEGAASDFGNNNNGTWSCTMTLVPPDGWQFNPSGATTYAIRNGRNATSVSGVLTSGSLVLTINGTGKNKQDRITITGLQVRAAVSSSDGTFTPNGYIYCTGFTNMPADEVVTGASGTNFCNLSQSPQPITGTTTVCVLATTTLSDLTAGGTWSSGNTTIATVNSSTGVVTGAGTGTTTITYTAGGCPTWKTVTVYPLPTVTGVLSPSTQCVGNTISLSATASGGSGSYSSYSWTGPNGFSSTAQNTNRTISSSADGGTYIVAVTDSRGCVSALPDTGVLTVSSPSVVGTFTVCTSSAIALSNTGGAGTWSSGSPSIASVNSSTGLVTAGGSSGTATITFTLTSTGCKATQVVTVLATPAVISGTATVCAGAATTLSNAEPNGTWSSSDVTIATVGSLTGVVSGVSAGTATITYGTGCGTAATKIVTVAGGPIVAPATVCTGSNTTLSNVTTGGTWMSSTLAVGTIGSANGVLRGIAMGTTTISYTVAGCTMTKVVSVTVTPSTMTNTSVCNGSTVSFSNSALYGTWSSSNTGIATVGSTGLVTSVSPGTALILYTTGCGAPSTQTATLTVNPTPVAIAGSMTICNFSSTTLTDATGGGTWISGATGVATIGSTNGVMTGVTAGTAGITYKLTVGGCSATTVVTINQTPAAITGNLSVCNNDVTSLSNPTGSGTWSSSNTAIALVGAAGDLNGISPGTATVYYTLSNGCFASKIATVNALPNISGTFSLCLGKTTTLSADISGGTWSSDDPTTATIGASNGLVSTVDTGIVTITYLTSVGCRNTQDVTVNQVPANVTGTTVVCVNASTTLSDATIGGSWISENGTIATVGSSTGIVTGVSAGTVRISYSMPGNCIATTVVTVNAIPNTIDNNTTTLCVGGSTMMLSDITGGGTWQSSTTSVATIGNTTGVVSPVAVGTSTITYKLTATGCYITTVATVNVVPGAIGGNAVMCAGGSNVTLTNSASGGTWTSSNTVVATIDPAMGTVTPLTAGTSTISYSSGNGATCLATAVVTVNAAPSAIGGNTAMCVGGSTVTLTNSAPVGTWTSSNIAKATINSSTGVMAAVAAGNSTISYSTGFGAGCVATVNATVNSAPGAIGGNTVMCASGATVTLTNGATGGSWSSSNTGIAMVDAITGVMTPVAGGNTIINYTTGSGAACLATVNATVTATAPTAVSASASPNPICVGGNLVLTGSATGATSWLWNGPNGYTSASQSPTLSGIAAAGAGIYTLSATNVCGTSTVTTTAVSVTTGVPTAVSASASPNPICVGGNLVLTGSATGATSWLWDGPNGYSSASQSPTLSGITAAGAGIYTLSAINVCGTSTVTTTAVNVTTAAPTAVSASASPNPICAGGNLVLTGSATGATSWLWNGPNGYSSASQSPTLSGITAAGAGVYTLSATNVCGTSTVTTTAVSVTTGAPTAVSASASPNPICAGGNLVLTGSATGATSWLWNGPNGYTSASQSPTLSGITAAGAGVYTLSATNVCGTSTVTTTAVSVTTGAPTVVSASASPNPICVGGNLVLTGSATGATSWLWDGPNGYSSASQSPTLSGIAAAGAGIYTLSATNVCGTTSVTTTAVNVTTAAPTAVSASASPNPICVGGNLVLTGSATGATSWLWNGPNGYTSASQSPTLSGITAAGAGVYTLSATNVCGTSTITTTAVSVTNGAPTVVSASASPNPICAGGNLVLTGSATGATSWLWDGPNGYSSASQSPTLSGIAAAGAGVYTLSATNVCGTSTVTTTAVSVTTGAPTAVSASASPNPICVGGNLVLTGSATGATSWLWDGLNGYTSASQSPTLSGITAAGAGIYTLSATNVCGTSTVTTTAVSVTTGAPTVVSASASPNPICVGGNLVLTGSATGATSWLWNGPNGYSSASQSPTLSGIAAAGAGVYTLSATNVCGTSTVTTTAVSVTTGAPTAVSASASPNPICVGGNLVLTGSATGATSWLWDGPNGYTSGYQSPTLSGITAAGAGVYTLSATNVCGTSTVSTTAVSVTTGAPTAVSASASPNPICVGGNLVLTGSATGATSWAWNGPNGYTSASQSPTLSGITAAGAGVYTLSATNVCGTSTITTTAVSVTNGAPTVVSASASPNPICAGGNLVLTGSATDATSWLWDGPNGYTSASQSPTLSGITAAGAGVYTLSATNVCGTSTVSTTSVSVTTGAPTAVSASASPNPICVGGNLVLTGSATGATSWAWNGPNSYSSTSQSPTLSGITAAGAGVYTLSATNVCGTSTVSTTAVSVTTGAPTAVSASASPNPICAGGNLVLTGSATDATSWLWDGPNGYTSASQSPTLSGITAAGAGVYTLSATNVCGTTTVSTTSVSVTSGAPTAVSASASPNPICVGGNLVLTGSATGATSWLWDGPNGYTSASQSPTLSGITAAGAGIYTLSATNVCGTSTVTTTAVSVTTGAPTAVSASASPNPICVGGNLVLTGSATGATSWTWVGPNGYTSASQSPTLSGITAAGAGVYTLSATNVCGTSTVTTTAVSVTTGAPTAVSASASPNPICVGGNLVLTGSATGATSWAWNGPNGYTSGYQSPTLSGITAAGAGVYTLSATNVCGTSTVTTTAVSVTTGAPTAVSASASPNAICVGGNLVLTGSATGATSWLWDGPNGYSSASQSPTLSGITAAGAGIYTLSAINVCGTTSVTTTVVNVTTAAPTAVSASASPNPICVGGNLVLTGSATGATSWLWNGPNGYSSASQSPTLSGIAAAGAGVYTLSATNVCGTSTVTTTAVSVTTGAPTVVSASASPTPICVGGNLVLTGSATGATSWLWNGPNGYTSASQSPTLSGITAAGAGVYTLSATNVCGTSTVTTTAVSVTTGAPTAVSASASPNPICVGGNLVLTGSATGATSWLWDGPNGYSSASQSPTLSGITAAGAGIYTLSATNVCGTTTVTTTAVSVTTGAPTAVSASGSPNPICVGGNLVLTGSATGATSWLWDGPNGYTSASQSPTLSGITAAGAGIYTLSATNVCGTSTVTTTAVSVSTGAPTAVSASASPNPICVGGNLVLTGSATGATSWLWNGPNGYSSASQSPTLSGITAAGAGVYTLSATNVCGTSTVTTTAVSVSTGAPTAVSASASPNPICAGGNLVLTGSATGATSWLWNGPNGYTSASQSPTLSGITAASAGVYTLSATNVCGNATATTSSVTVNPQPSVVNATASPNPLCSGDNLTLSGSVTGGSSLSYSWSGPNGYSAAILNPSSFGTTVTASGIYSLTVTAAGCSGVTGTTAMVSVNPLPAAVNVSGAGSFCGNATITADNGGDGTIYFQGTTSNGTFTTTPSTSALITSSGTYYFRALSANGCWGPEGSVNVTINTLATAITGTAQVCVSSTTTLSDAASGGSWTSSNAGVATVGSGSGIVSGVAAGTTTVTYTLGSGCYVTKTVTVYGLPGTFSGSQTVCEGSVTTLSNAVPGGSWTSGTISVATIGSGTGIVSGVVAGTSMLTYTLNSGCQAMTVVTVNTAPSAIGGATVICAASTTTMTNAVAGGAWSSSAISVASIGSASGIMTGVASGNATIIYTLPSGCIASTVVTVNSQPSVISGSSAVCEGSIITLTNGIPGGTWTSGNTAIATIDPSNAVMTGVAAGTVDITYTISSGCFRTKVLTVTTSPAAIAGSSTVCVGMSTTLTNSVAGGAWSSSGVGTASVGASGIVTGVTTGTTTISYAIGSCVATKIMTSNPIPNSLSGTTSICAGSVTTLSSGTTGGTWTSSNNAVATIDAASGIVNGVTDGTATMTYSISDGCFRAMTVTVNPLPAVITGSSPICIGSTITLADVTVTGIWSSSSSIATVGSTSGIVTGVSAGTAAVSYTLATGCRATAIVTVLAAPAAINGSTTVCAGSTITLTNTTGGGQWSTSDASLATIGLSSGILTGVSAGNPIVTYTLAAGCYRTQVITVNAFPGTITGIPTVCAGAQATLGNAVTGGTWSSSSTSVATVGATTGIVTGVAGGNATITYNVGAGCNVTQVVTVNPILPITGIASACLGMTTTLSDGTGGGTWTSGDLTVATIGSSNGIVSGISQGTVVVTYTVSSGCSRTTVVSVNPAPSAISGMTAICAGFSSTLSNIYAGGTWSTSNPAIAQVNASAGVVTGVAVGTANITYLMGAGCTASITVTVSTIPANTGTMSVCAGATTALSNTIAGGTWSTNNASIADVDGASGVVTGIAAGTAIVTYSPPAGCAKTSTVTVKPIPAAIGGTRTVCVGATTLITDVTPGGVSWMSSDNSIATVGSTTGSVTGVSAGIVTMTYTINTGCYVTGDVTVNATPAPIAGATSVCAGSVGTLDDAIGGGSWSVSNTNVATVISNTGVVTGIASGTAIVTYAFVTGCKATTILTVNPIAATTGTATVCEGAVTTLSNTTSGGTWSSSDNTIATVGASSGIVSGVLAGNATITYATAAGCTRMTVVTVNQSPASISGSLSLCIGSSSSLSNAVTGGTWNVSNATIASIGSATGVVTGAATGTVNVTYTLPGTCRAISVATVNTMPAAITGALNVCAGSTTTLTDVTTGGTWSTANPAIAAIGSGTGIVTGVAAGATTATYMLGTGCYKTTTVYVNPLPAAISGPSTVCVASQIYVSNSTSGGVSWTSSNTSVATVGVVTGMVTGVSAGTTNITYTLNTGCITAKTITVNPLPAAITGTTTMCPGLSTTLHDATAGGSWSSNTIAVGSADGIVTGTAAGTAMVSYTINTGCYVTSPVTVYNSLPIEGANMVCVGSSATVSNYLAGGTWISSNTSIATIGSTTGYIDGVSAGTVMISYYNPNGCLMTSVVTANATPDAGIISGASNLFIGSITTLGETYSGGIWSSSDGTVASIDSMTGVVTGASGGAATISYAFDDGCGLAYATYAMTVSSCGGAAGAITGTLSACVGATTELIDAIAGGTWSTSNISIAAVDSTTGIVSGVAAGTATITYMIAGGCAVTAEVTINALPIAISGSSSVCAGASTTLSDATAGGSWSSSNAGVVMIDFSSGIATGISVGAATITYQSADGCITTQAVTVNSLPAAISGTFNVCEGGTITLGDAATGGTWSSSDAGKATVGLYSGIVSGMAAGVSNITYTTTGGCYQLAAVTVNTIPVSITGPSAVCVNSSITLSDLSSGGTWSSSTPAVAIVGGTTGIVNAQAAGTTIISYVLPTGCMTIKVVTVQAIPAAITGAQVFCQGATSLLSDATSNGTWSTLDGSVATVGSISGMVTGVAGGTARISYTLSTGCYNTAVVTINATPAAIGGSTASCVGNTTTLTNAMSAGAWTSSNTSVATISMANGIMTGVAAGTAVISYAVSGCYTTAVVTVNNVPFAIGGLSTVCEGAAITLTDATSGGSWSSSNSSMATVGASTGVVNGVSSGAINIIYTLPGGCQVAKSVTVLATPASITGTAYICTGATATLNNSTPSGSWSSANTAVANIGASTGTVSGVAPGTAIVSYTVANGCSNTAVVTVNQMPGSVIGATAICQGASTALSDLTSGGSWSSSNPGIASIGSATGILSGVAAGNSVVTYTMPTGCQATATVTVNGTIAPVTGPTSVCGGATITLTDATTGGSWSSSNTSVATVGSSTGILTGAAAGTSVITYNAGGCQATYVVTVNAAPGVINGVPAVCLGLTTTLTNTVAGGIWSSSNATVATVGSSTGIVSGVAIGNATIDYTTGSGCSASLVVTVGSVPSSVTGTLATCAGTTTSLSNPTNGGTWSTSNAAVATVGSGTGVVTGVAAGTARVTYNLGAGCSATAVVTVVATPAVISGTAVVCEGAAATLMNSTAGGTWSSNNSSIATIGSSSGVLTGLLAGNATVTYQLGTGCYRTANVTVNASPVAIAGNAAPVCVGSSFTLTDAIAGGTWSVSNGSVSIGSATGIVTGVAAGMTTISYNIGSCRSTTIVTVNAVPSSIGGAAVICANRTVNLNCGTPGGTWSSSDNTIATVSSTGTVSGVSDGQVTISYTLSTGCYAIRAMTLNSITSILGPTAVCAGATISLTDTTPGGSWSISSVAYGTIDAATGIVTGMNAGSATVTYTVPTGCFATATVTVNPIKAITGTASACEGLSTTLADATAGGTWSSSNIGVATVGAATGVVTGVANGLATISYILPTGCFSTKSVTINAFPTAITGTATVCAGSATTLNNAVTGGTWSSASASIATVGSATGIVTGVAGGTTTITYSAGSGCNVTKVVTVSAILPITGGASACQGMTTTLGDASAGGTWSSSNASVASVGSTGIVSGIGVGTSVITYTIGSGCARTIVVTINVASSTILGATTVCAGFTSSLSGDVAGGTWTSSNGAVVTIGSTSGVLTGVSAGAATVTYTSGLGCYVTTGVVVNGIAAITGTAKTCVGQTSALSNTTPGGVWSSSDAGIASVDAGGVVSGVSAGTVVITYNPSSGCYRTVVFTVNASPAAIGGGLNTCVGSTGVVTDITPGGVSYTSSNTAVATVGITSGAVTGLSGGTTIITYTVNTGCISTAEYTVNPVPAVITGSANLCVGMPSSLSSATPDGTWSISNVGRASIGSITGVITGISTGTANVTYTSAAGCSATTQVIVNAAISAGTISGTASILVAGTTTFSSTVSGGVWTSSDATVASVVASSGVVTGAGAGLATITYSVTTGCGTAIATKGVTVSTSRPEDPANASIPVAQINLYPNPTTGVFTIEAPVNGTLGIYDVSGKEAGRYAIGRGITEVTLSHELSRGVYMCRFMGEDGGTTIVRLILE